MGILEFFGTLIKNDITSSSIKSNFLKIMTINHLFLDFNSIIHVSSQKILVDVNTFLRAILKNLYNSANINNTVFTEKFILYKMENIQKKITKNSSPENVIAMFKEHFADKYLDKLIITLVINTVLHIMRTYCQGQTIYSLMLAIDGVPSKGKMIEQKQRRYLGAITEKYKQKILNEYKEYLLEEDNYIYLATHDNIEWSRNKITPGTAFMHKLVNYLKNDKIQTKIKTNRPKIKIIISDMYEVGEGEKKIVNYINRYFTNTDDSIMIYSPDADMILLCMLLPVNNLYMLRHNQQTSMQSNTMIYDLIDILMLKNNISYYINNHPNYSKEQFDVNRINYDIVCISTLFGNDFVPKIETLNVKKGFQNILDAYLKTLLKLKEKKRYLVKLPSLTCPQGDKVKLPSLTCPQGDKVKLPSLTCPQGDKVKLPSLASPKRDKVKLPKGDNKQHVSQFHLSFSFFKNILNFLLPEEDDFIKHNELYNQYITIGQIKNVFDYVEITSENLVPIFNKFRQEYENLKNLIKNNGNYSYFKTNDMFMNSLKKSIVVIMNEQPVNTSYLTNIEMIKLLKDYYYKYKDFPWLNINLNTWSHSINDFKHKKIVKEKNFNEYQREIYKFDNMLDEYYIKFNTQPLNLTKKKINEYYSNYFGVTLFNKDNSLTKETNQIMHDYLEGILWVFNYYYNDATYINSWYYEHEKAPLIKHLLIFLNSINIKYFTDVFINLDKYQIDNFETYFNPIEQLIYVSPMTNKIIKLLPSNYQKYITSADLDLFLKNYFININEITNRLWNSKISNEIDCHSVMFFNKCLIKSITKPTKLDDKLFLKAIRKVQPNTVSSRRSVSAIPVY